MQESKAENISSQKQKIDANRKEAQSMERKYLFYPIVYGNRLQLEFHYRRTQENLYLKVPTLLFRIQSYPYVHTK